MFLEWQQQASNVSRFVKSALLSAKKSVSVEQTCLASFVQALGVIYVFDNQTVSVH